MKTGQRILLAGENSFGSTVYSVEEGLRLEGWDVIQVNTENFIRRPNSNFSRLINRVIGSWAVNAYNKAIIKMTDQYEPDYFLTVKGTYLRPETLRYIRSKGIPTVNYYPDYHFSYASVDRRTLFEYEIFFTTKSFQIDYLRNTVGIVRVIYLPHGYCDSVHMPPSKERPAYYDNDLLYIGTYNDEKLAWLEKIRSHFPSIDMAVYGNGWTSAQVSSALRAAIKGRPLLGREYCEAIYHSRLNLAIHMGSVDSSGWKDLVSTRTFEIPAVRGFMLHVDNDEVRTFFTPDTEIALFSDSQSLFDNIENYLSIDRKRQEMIEQAYRKCVPEYGYNNRCKYISKTLKAN